MIEYAKGKGLRGFTADILGGNEAMLKLIKKCVTVTMKPTCGTFEVEVIF